MIPAGYSQALADYATAIGDVSSLVAERDALYTQKIANGGEGSKVLVNSELQNKQFGFQVTMTVEEKFTALVDAINLYNGTKTAMTYGAFGLLQR